MSETDNKWPLPDYDPGPATHIHAIGVIALTYSSFERSLEDLFFSQQKSNPNVIPQYLKMNEERRLKALRGFFKHCNTGEQIPALGSNLIDYFKWCQKCRHLILHSERYPATFGTDDTLFLTKPVGKQDPSHQYMKFTLSELRSIADRIRKGVIQSAEISLYLRYHNNPESLPEDYRTFATTLPQLLLIPEPLGSSDMP